MEADACVCHRPTVLIVEGDRRVRRAMQMLVTTLADSVNVLTVASTASAVSHAVRLAPGVAVVDLRPVEGAADLDVIRGLHGVGWSVVALSSQSGLSGAALAHGAAAFVDTGVEPDEIIRLVRQLLDHPPRDWRSDAIGAPD